MFTCVTKQLVDLQIGNDNRKKYKNIKDKLDMILECYNPNQTAVFLKNFFGLFTLV